MAMIGDACTRGVAAVVVTHDPQLASWADRIVFLRDGRMVDHMAPGGPDPFSASAAGNGLAGRGTLEESR
jgi:putative ABC transport system ATP-binding protein